MKVNGQEIVLEKEITLEEFLRMKNYDLKRIAVECNGEIIPKDQYAVKHISSRDNVEVVSFVGGG